MPWSSNLFTVSSQDTKTLSITPFNLEVFSIGKVPPKHSLQPPWKGSYQVLLTNPWATKLQGTDSGIQMTHLKKAPNTDWTCTPSADLKVKNSQN